ncbi:hypothetical protein AMAG_10738 [Allomyces macrogynus ATCC 38327]|uniref:Uncharacterized protein n=1 Tax=Allomyces macrogynus (strain ATCC 38327) TaxID=578462 RepID=A0A0L0SRU9_ALLM3|nr:hypothetical protein AMAG_10738 [Allomyces macrogynus ATCC 38327]|eukprot:KNE65074.1 hypothetical protein AMAG_10738 [Allomyces macrogynus ATCC 38327]
MTVPPAPARGLAGIAAPASATPSLDNDRDVALALAAAAAGDSDPLTALLTAHRAAHDLIQQEAAYWQRKAAASAAEAARLQEAVARAEGAEYRAQARIGDLTKQLEAARITSAAAVAPAAAHDDHTVPVDEDDLVELARAGGADSATDGDDSLVRHAARRLRAQEAELRQLRDDVHELGTALETATVHVAELEDHVRAVTADVTHLDDLNKSLMEENEAFQMLLSERTVAGEFYLSPVAHGPKDDEFAAVRPMSPAEAPLSPATPAAPTTAAAPAGLSLAEEMVKPAAGKDAAAEVARVQAENRALQLYIEKVLARIMDHPDLQQLLAHDYAPGTATVPSATGTPNANGTVGSRPTPSAAARSRGSSKRFSWIPRKSSIANLAAAAGFKAGSSSSTSKRRSSAASTPSASAVAENKTVPIATTPARATVSAVDSNGDASITVDVLSPLPPR